MAISKDYIEAQDPTPAANGAGRSDSAGKPLQILLVEDHADTAAVIKLVLRKAGHCVQIGDCVQAGLTKLQEQPFDLLLSDLGLPDGSGLDLIRTIRATSTIPAVALTGYGMDDDIARCREAGFDRHITKPVNFVELIAMIRGLLPGKA